MDCVNEILSKNCVPAEFEEFLLRLFQQTFHLLQRITKDTGVQTAGHKLLELDERSEMDETLSKTIVLLRKDWSTHAIFHVPRFY